MLGVLVELAIVLLACAIAVYLVRFARWDRDSELRWLAEEEPWWRAMA